MALAEPSCLCAPCWAKLNQIDEPCCEVMGTPFAYDQGEGAVSAVGLAAIGYFRGEHEKLSVPDLGVHHRDRIFEIALSPSPPATQRLGGIEPGNGFHAFGLRIRLQHERWIVLEKEVHSVTHAKRERIRIVDSRLQHGTGHVELSSGKRHLFAVG